MDEANPSLAVGLSVKEREKVAFIWSVKETLCDHYKRHQYQDVILPFCVLRRLDCVLEPTKDKVVAKAAEVGSDKWDAATDVLSHVAGQPFWNASRFTFGGLLADQHNVRQNVHAYLRGFSPNARDALVRFGLPNQINKLAEAGILYMVVKQFAEKPAPHEPRAVSDDRSRGHEDDLPLDARRRRGRPGRDEPMNDARGPIVRHRPEQ